MRFSQSELEDIVFQHVKSVHHKAKLISFIAVATERGCCESKALSNNDLLTDSPNKVVAMQAAERIATWIETTWPNHTVRAKMAQKIAKLIREGEWVPAVSGQDASTVY